MDEESGWSIDIENLSHVELVEMIKSLEGSEHKKLQKEARI